MTHNLFLSILLHCEGLVSLASERASTVFSELVSYFCLRFRVEPVPSAHRGRVQWWQKLYCQFFFSAGNVFFERNRKIPLCFFIFPEGPRVTEVTKLKILSQLEDWELLLYYYSRPSQYQVPVGTYSRHYQVPGTGTSTGRVDQ